MSDPSKRAEMVAGLRRLADLLEDERVPLPQSGLDVAVWLSVWQTSAAAVRAALADAARGMGFAAKEFTDSSARLTKDLGGGVKLTIATARSVVCSRRVVGTKEVTKTVPDPTVEVPTVTVTETEEIVEWDCAPMLAAGEGQ